MGGGVRWIGGVEFDVERNSIALTMVVLGC